LLDSLLQENFKLTVIWASSVILKEEYLFKIDGE